MNAFLTPKNARPNLFSYSAPFAALIAIAGSFISANASAQSTPTPITIGLGVAASPRYEGAADYHATPFPIISATHGMFFINGLEAGAAVPLGKEIRAGVILTPQFGRDDTDEKRLNGIGDVKTSAAYGAFIRWQHGPFETSAKYLQSAHSNYGATVTLSTQYTLKIGARDSLGVGADAVWANTDAMQTTFGLTDAQAANSAAGLSRYSPSAGFKRVDTNVIWRHQINPSWSVNGLFRVATLIGDAKNSPIVEQPTSVFAGLGLAYTF